VAFRRLGRQFQSIPQILFAETEAVTLRKSSNYRHVSVWWWILEPPSTRIPQEIGVSFPSPLSSTRLKGGDTYVSLFRLWLRILVDISDHHNRYDGHLLLHDERPHGLEQAAGTKTLQNPHWTYSTNGMLGERSIRRSMMKKSGA
jgi:hypothetical protein